MNIEQKHELMFIIAKYLQTLFPDVAKTFIKRCESENLFPKPVFSQNATFEELQTSFLSGVPDDQLIRIISHVQNNSKFSSLLASMKQTTQNANSNSNIVGSEDSGGLFDMKLLDDLLCDSLRNQINPLQTVIPPFHCFAAQQRIISHFDKIYCLAVDITSQVLITGSDDFLVKIWKIPEMIPMKTFDVHIDSITDLQIHPSNLYFCSSSHDSTITVFSFTNNGRVVLKLKMEKMIHNIKFSPCGTLLGAACHEGCVSIWNFNQIIEFDKNSQNNNKLKRSDYNIEPIKIINSPHKGPAAWLSFSPNGSFVAFSCDPNLVIVSAINENYSVQLRGHTESPDFVFFSKITCNKILSLSSRERGVRLWESQNDIWDKSTFLTMTRKIRIYQAAFNCDESRIIGVSSKMIIVWDAYSKQQLFILSHSEYVDHATIVSPHPTIPSVVFIATSEGRTSLWDVINGQFICGLQSERRIEILEAIWSPDGQYIFTSDVLGGVTIYTSDPVNKTRKISDLVPYTEMFFLNEIIDKEEKEEKERETTVKENTFTDKSIFNQSYYRKVNNKNYEVDTLITDRIKNPLLPQPERFYIHDLRLQVQPTKSYTPPFESTFSMHTDEEYVALNHMKALFKGKRQQINDQISTEINQEASPTVVPNYDESSDATNDDDDKHPVKGGFTDSGDEYETSFDGENIQRRKKKSREEAEREREERLKRRHRILAESENESGFSSESTIASRRKRRKPANKPLSRVSSSSSSTTNIELERRKKNSRIKLRNFSSSSAANSEDQEYEIDSVNENEDENEEYEDEIEFEKEIADNEEEEDEEEKRETRSKPQRKQKQKPKTATKQKPKIKSRSKPKKVQKKTVSQKKKSAIQTRRTTRHKTVTVSNSSSDSSSDTSSSADTVQADDEGYSSSSSSSDEQELQAQVIKPILPLWTFATKPRVHTYIPQVGDEVVYLRKGHSDWRKECNLMRFTPPYQIRADLPEVAEARISEIRFYVTHLIITLQFYDYNDGSGSDKKAAKKKKNEQNENYDKIASKFALTDKKHRKILFDAKIAYPMPDSPQFIIRSSRFVYSMLYTLSLKQNDIVKVEFAAPENSKNTKNPKNGRAKNDEDDDVQLFMGKIKSIDTDWINDPWQCINVIFTDDKKPGKLQPWELIFDEGKIKKTLHDKIMSHSISKMGNNDVIENIIDSSAKMERLNDYMVRFVSEMLQKKENSRFVQTRSQDDQKTLRRKSKFPMDLTLINDRLANRWYTSVESLKQDISLIKSNAQLLIDLDPNLADRITEQLLKHIEVFSNAKDKTKAQKPKESESDSETDSDEASQTDESTVDESVTDTSGDSEEEESSSEPISKIKKDRITNVQKRSVEKPPQKPLPRQTRSRESSNTRTRQIPKSVMKKESDSSSSDSTVSSTTSASSSITTTSSESE